MSPKGLTLHLAVDNCSLHSNPEVQALLAKLARFFMHVTPTGASWLTMVARTFHGITDKRIQRDCSISLPELGLANDLYVVKHNAKPKPFARSASVDSDVDSDRPCSSLTLADSPSLALTAEGLCKRRGMFVLDADSSDFAGEESPVPETGCLAGTTVVNSRRAADSRGASLQAARRAGNADGPG